MKAVKRVNNNVVICRSTNGEEFVARGKGIGFHEFPYDLDIKNVERTYYDVDPNYISVINSISDEIIKISEQIANYASTVLKNPLGSNLIFTLADHINFAIERNKKNLLISFPISYDIEHLYENEYSIGKFGLKIIREQLKIWLPKDEAISIALHIINAETIDKNKLYVEKEIINDITTIIEDCFDIRIDKSDFNYSRFISHMNYLIKRGISNQLVNTQNQDILRLFAESSKILWANTQETYRYRDKFL